MSRSCSVKKQEPDYGKLHDFVVKQRVKYYLREFCTNRFEKQGKLIATALVKDVESAWFISVGLNFHDY